MWLFLALLACSSSVCAIEMEVIKIGHRGACGYEPENTLRSFLKAVELGCDMIELDVHLCKSGQLVVIHDETVDRTTNGSGRVAGLTLDQLKKLDAGKGEQISTLAEVLYALKRKVKVNVELKGPNTAGPVVALIEKTVTQGGWSYDDFLVSSFDHYKLRDVSRLNSRISTGILLRSVPIGVGCLTLAVGACFVVIDFRMLRPEFMEEAHRFGLSVFVYTANGRHDIERVQSFGVDGIISNFPDRL